VFRYSGEGFAVVFSGKDVGDAVPHLEALRKGIKRYRLAIRAPDKPAKPEAGGRCRVGKPSAKTVSVTVSIGMAGRVAERLAGGGDRGSRRSALPR
jgi:GGDEF domain-containing protein